MLTAQDKYAIMFIGDDRTEEAINERRLFDDVAKGIGLDYVWVLPTKPLASDTTGCKYTVDYICNYNKERKSINVMLKVSEMDGSGGFEVSIYKDNADFEKDGRVFIGRLVKIVMGNIAVMQELR